MHDLCCLMRRSGCKYTVAGNTSCMLLTFLQFGCDMMACRVTRCCWFVDALTHGFEGTVSSCGHCVWAGRFGRTCPTCVVLQCMHAPRQACEGCCQQYMYQ